MTELPTDDARFARELWRRLETIHAVTYFAPEAVDHAQRIGVTGFWRTYFGYRAAPLGACSAATATAAFFGFAPAMVARAIPAIWDLAPPALLLDARSASAAQALRRLAPVELRTLLDETWAIDALNDAVDRGNAGHLPLYLANRDLPPTDDPTVELWQLATTLREQRGDGHVAAWTVKGFAPVDVAVLFVAAGGTSREALQPNRGWEEHEWQDAITRNTRDGLLTADGNITEPGAALVNDVELTTDQLASAPFEALDSEDRLRLLHLLEPLVRAVTRSELIPAVNPMGVPLLEDEPR